MAASSRSATTTTARRWSLRRWARAVTGRHLYLGWTRDLRARSWPRETPADIPADVLHPDLRAGLPRRLATHVIGMVAFLLAGQVIVYIVAYGGQALGQATGWFSGAGVITAINWTLPTTLLVWATASTAAESSPRGGFWERRMVGTAVVDAFTAEPGISTGRAIRRRLLSLVDLLFLPFALAWAALDDGRLPHDRFTGTRVALVPPDGQYRRDRDAHRELRRQIREARKREAAR